jgi:hypothetical protein
VDVSARERLAAALDAIYCGPALCFEPEAVRFVLDPAHAAELKI